jgi:hypothetical protein
VFAERRRSLHLGCLFIQADWLTVRRVLDVAGTIRHEFEMCRGEFRVSGDEIMEILNGSSGNPGGLEDFGQSVSLVL